jgi:hypothetical protein
MATAMYKYNVRAKESGLTPATVTLWRSVSFTGNARRVRRVKQITMHAGAFASDVAVCRSNTPEAMRSTYRNLRQSMPIRRPAMYFGGVTLARLDARRPRIVRNRHVSGELGRPGCSPAYDAQGRPKDPAKNRGMRDVQITGSRLKTQASAVADLAHRVLPEPPVNAARQ